MGELSALVRLILATVFAVAAVGKWLSTDGTPRLLDTYELDSRLAPAVTLLPLFDILIAIGISLDGTSRAAGALAFASLVVFSWLIQRSLRRGHQGNCQCFGRLHSSDISRRSLVRNGALAMGAAWIAVGRHERLVPTLAHGVYLNGSLLVAVVVVLAMLAFVLRRLPTMAHSPVDASTTIRPELNPLDLADDIDRFATLDGGAISLQALHASEADSILIFVDPGCGPCQTVMPIVRHWWHRLALAVFVVVSNQPTDEVSDFFDGIPADHVVIDRDVVLAARYHIEGTPSAVLMSSGGSVAPAVVTGPMAIEVLLRHSAAPSLASRHLPSWLLPAARARARTLTAVRTGADDLRSAMSRRQVFTAAGVGTMLTLAASTLDSGPVAASKEVTARCPSCGTCIDCDWNTATPGSLQCHPCHEPCSNAKLCSSFAYQFADYVTLVKYLHANGFTQNGEPTASGLTKNGTQAYLALITTFKGTSAKNPSALLLYQLTTTESAAVLLLDGEGLIASVVTVNPAGKLVAGSVAPTPSTSRSSASTDIGGPITMELVGSSVASCEDVCGQAWKLIVTGFQVLAASSGIGLVVLLAAYALPALGSQGSSDANALKVVSSIASASSITNLAFRLAKSQGVGALKNFDEKVICKPICSIKLKACCNYSGACFDSDARCESLCPGGLAHPMAHCDVYINGKKVSTLIPGAV